MAHGWKDRGNYRADVQRKDHGIAASAGKIFAGGKDLSCFQAPKRHPATENIYCNHPGRTRLFPISVTNLETYTSVPLDADVVVLDEAQFFEAEVINFCQDAKDQGKIVLVGGLDMDFNRVPFGYMGSLMAIADSVTKLTAVCACGRDAIYTKKISGDKTRQVEIGDHYYVPCCAECY